MKSQKSNDVKNLRHAREKSEVLNRYRDADSTFPWYNGKNVPVRGADGCFSSSSSLNTHYNFRWYCLFSWRHARPTLRSFVEQRYELSTRGYLIQADTARRFSQKRLPDQCGSARNSVFESRVSSYRQPTTFLLMCITYVCVYVYQPHSSFCRKILCARCWTDLSISFKILSDRVRLKLMHPDSLLFPIMHGLYKIFRLRHNFSPNLCSSWTLQFRKAE